VATGMKEMSLDLKLGVDHRAITRFGLPRPLLMAAQELGRSRANENAFSSSFAPILRPLSLAST
jgi:hypothetical protein